MNVEPIRARWRDQPAPSVSSAETVAGDLFRSAPLPQARKTQAVMAMLRELRKRQPAGSQGFLQRGPLRAAVALSVFFSLNFAMALTVPPVKRWWSNTLGLASTRLAASPAPSVVPAAVNPPRLPEVAPPADPSALLLVSPAPTENIPARRAAVSDGFGRRLRPNPAPSELPAAAVAVAPHSPLPPPSSLATESELISRALTALGQGQPAPALATLATYREQFPNGSLAYEATLAEVKAEMAAGQSGPALSALERIMATEGFEERPRSSELALLHAELLAGTNECDKALPAFERLAGSADLEPPLAERALYGRAACFAAQGDYPGNQRALREYLRRFPSGRFAKPAREGLSRAE